MNIVLQLGGTWRRAHAAAETALKLDEDYTIVVSSEGNEPGFRGIYRDAGIPDDKVIHDTAAWDTVTNFTHTYKLLRSLKVDKLYVVTTGWHLPRSMAIAKEVWGGRVEIIPVAYRPEDQRDEDLQYLKHDKWRARIWRYLGVLFYWSNVAERRKAKLNQGHALIEIGIS